MAKKIRIKDIAETAGVSPGTVDRVLHNRGDVSEASRRRAEEARLEVTELRSRLEDREERLTEARNRPTVLERNVLQVWQTLAGQAAELAAPGVAMREQAVRAEKR